MGRTFRGTDAPRDALCMAGRTRAPSVCIPHAFVRQLPVKQKKHIGMTAYLCYEQLALFLHTEWQRVSFESIW